jgi:glucose/arabinose dehydrogenase
MAAPGGNITGVFLRQTELAEKHNDNYIGRPVDVEIMKDGSLLVSDDFNGAVYRVTYGTPRVSTR